MKILKLLNKKKFFLFLFLITFSNSFANEPVDIWNIEKIETEMKNTNQNNSSISSEISEEVTSVYDLNNQNNEDNQNLVLLENDLQNKDRRSMD